MADMIETVAKAICKSRTCEGINCCQWQCNGGRWHDSNNHPGKCRVDEGRYDDAARGALEAMQEPTEEMVNATGLWSGAAASFWKEMIGVALGSGQTAVQAKEEK